jgi:hypothetical protein
MYAVDVDRIPVEITDIMEYFIRQDHSNKIRLAGGAPRDLLLGAEVSDWDFFIPRETTLSKYDLTWFGFTRDVSKPKPMYAIGSQLFETSTWMKGDAKVQLIYSNQQIDDFDISTCQVALDMQGKVYVTSAFETSAEYRIHCVYLRAYNSLYQLTHGLFDHLPRVLKKYPWTVRLETAGVTKKQMDFFKGIGEF